MTGEFSYHESGPGQHEPPPSEAMNCGFLFLEPRRADLAIINNAKAPNPQRTSQVIRRVLFERLVAGLGRSSYSHVGMFAIGHDGIGQDVVWVDAATHDINEPGVHIRSLGEIPNDRKAHWLGYRNQQDVHRPGELCAHFTEVSNDLTQAFGKAALVKMAWLRVISYLSAPLRNLLMGLANPAQSGSDMVCSEFVASAMVTSFPHLANGRPGELWVPVDPAWLQAVQAAVDASHELYERRYRAQFDPPPEPTQERDDLHVFVDPGSPVEPVQAMPEIVGAADAYLALATFAQPVEDYSEFGVDGLTIFDLETGGDAGNSPNWMFDLGRDFGGSIGTPLINPDDLERWQPGLRSSTRDEPPAGFRKNIHELVRTARKENNGSTWLRVGWMTGELPPFLVTPQHLFDHRGSPPD